MEIEESPNFAYFLGVILGDSSIHDNRITFTARDSEFRAKFVEIGKKIIGKEPQILKRVRRDYLEIEIRFHSPEFLHILESWLNLNGTSFRDAFGSKSHNSDNRTFINIYNFIRKTRENAKAFIEGFYDSEGTCYQFTRTLKSGQQSRYRGEIAIYNTNKELLQFVQTMLLDFFKIESKLYLQHPKGTIVFWPNNEAQHFIKRTKDCWNLRIMKQFSVREFAHCIHSSVPRKNLNLENP